MNKLSNEEFLKIADKIKVNEKVDLHYLYNVYSTAYDTIEHVYLNQNVVNKSVDSYEIISYALGEFLYSSAGISGDSKEKFLSDDAIFNSMCSVVADKYISLSLFNHSEQRLTSKFLPPISSLNLYVNLMSNIISLYKRNDPKNTLIVDLLTKSLSIMRSSISLLCDGYETEAFAVWRTLHECECTLILINKYGDLAVDAYLKHMRYGIAFKGGYPDKNQQDSIMAQVKAEMAEIGLKSKDTKKYIEYGWMNAIPESKTLDGFKLNFRDGLETLAGLHNKSEIYMTSSEILHSTPLLIYSNKQYFYFVTLLNLYESFFRIENVFQPLFFNNVDQNAQKSYIEMRNLYYSQLINIYKRESATFNNLFGKNANKKTD